MTICNGDAENNGESKGGLAMKGDGPSKLFPNRPPSPRARKLPAPLPAFVFAPLASQTALLELTDDIFIEPTAIQSPLNVSGEFIILALMGSRACACSRFYFPRCVPLRSGVASFSDGPAAANSFNTPRPLLISAALGSPPHSSGRAPFGPPSPERPRLAGRRQRRKLTHAQRTKLVRVPVSRDR